MSSPNVFRAASVLALLALSIPVLAQNPPLDTIRVASGLIRPLFVTAPPGDTQRAFIVEQRTTPPGSIGYVRILDVTTNTLEPSPYLSVAISGCDEQGLLGLAFHPDFANNGYFFVYSTPSSTVNVVRRFQASSPYMTSTVVDPTTESAVITLPHPSSCIHNGGWIGFGPDGYLYVASGDGGPANDPLSSAQNLDSHLGKILRIDVDGDDYPADLLRNYAIPLGNPFAGPTPGLDIVWSYGLRNPWRCSFDALTGELYIGDVGQNAWEEIDVEPHATAGRNYGWRCMEGRHCTGLSNCACASASFTEPVHEYDHSSGYSVIGGVVYRGNAICDLQGTYFFADLDGSIRSFRYTGSNDPPVVDRTAELAPGGGLSIDTVTSFGTDASGEIYICKRGSGLADGEVYKIVAGAITDCNANGTHDGCDIASGTSLDANANGIPDECESSVTPFCFGDGSGTACPCGNSGATGNGCASSIGPNGANLAGNGSASVGNDTLSLVGSGMPNSSALYFQGTTQSAGGAGTSFGDGKRCAGGALVRLGVEINVAGRSRYPSASDLPISIRGGILGAPQTRTYQAWYRNAASFCTPDTFNTTNGLSVVWVH